MEVGGGRLKLRRPCLSSPHGNGQLSREQIAQSLCASHTKTKPTITLSDRTKETWRKSMPATHWNWEESGTLVMILKIKPLRAAAQQCRSHFYENLKQIQTCQ